MRAALGKAEKGKVGQALQKDKVSSPTQQRESLLVLRSGSLPVLGTGPVLRASSASCPNHGPRAQAAYTLTGQENRTLPFFFLSLLPPCARLRNQITRRVVAIELDDHSISLYLQKP